MIRSYDSHENLIDSVIRFYNNNIWIRLQVVSDEMFSFQTQDSNTVNYYELDFPWPKGPYDSTNF